MHCRGLCTAAAYALPEPTHHADAEHDGRPRLGGAPPSAVVVRARVVQQRPRLSVEPRHAPCTIILSDR
jgi:hypothetical protein